MPANPASGENASSDNAGNDELREQTPAPQPEPLLTMHPLWWLPRLLVTAVVALVVVLGVIYALIPMTSAVGTAGKNLQKISREGAESYSRRFQAPQPPVPIYVPGNNPNGPFTPVRQ